MGYTDEDRPFMELAIKLARDDKRKFHVGAVVVKDGKKLGFAHGDAERKIHAELLAIERATEECRNTGRSLDGATLYTTLEPCVPDVRDRERVPCANVILNHGFARVVIGVTDPNPGVYREGISTLQRNRLTVDLCTDNDLTKQLRDLCKEFFEERWARYRDYPGFALDKQFRGRVEQRELLSKWVSRHGEHEGKPIGDRPILVLHAIGGMGKSNLSWLWTRRDVAHLEIAQIPEDPKDVEARCRLGLGWQTRVMWFSFYQHEGGADYSKFLEQAIEHFSAGTKRADDYVVDGQVDYSRLTDDLLEILKGSRCLIVWDGAERLLVEYSGADPVLAVHRDADQIKDDPAALRCSELAVSQFLWAIAGQEKTKILITSRLPFGDLLDSAGAVHVELKGFDAESAVGFLKNRGINGPDWRIEERAKWYEFHPQSLSNLAAALTRDFDAAGDIVGEPSFDPGMPKDVRRNHVLRLAFEKRALHRQQLLTRLAAVRGLISKDVVRLLAADIARPAGSNLGSDVDVLVTQGLLSQIKGTESYSLHPVVRHYAYTRLENKAAIHRRLQEHFRRLADALDFERVQTFEELLPAIEFYYHTAKSGSYGEACSFYYHQDPPKPERNLNRLLYFELGRYHTVIELLELLFPDGIRSHPQVHDMQKQAVFNDLALAYRNIGDLKRATDLLHVKLEVDVELGARLEAAWALETACRVALGYENWGQCMLLLGELEHANRDLKESRKLYTLVARRLGDLPKDSRGKADFISWKQGIDTGLAIVAEHLGKMLGYIGEFREAIKSLLRSATLDKSQQKGVSQQVALARICLLKRDTKKAREYAANAVKALTNLDPRNVFEPHRVMVEYVQGATELALGNLESSEEHLKDALARCRRAREVEQESPILLELGKLSFARIANAAAGEQKVFEAEAERFGIDSLKIAERCGYRLMQADTHNFLASYWLAVGDDEKALLNAEKAAAAAVCGVDPKASKYYYRPALQEAMRLKSTCMRKAGTA